VPTTSGVDPVATADKFAAFVKQYNLDGIDIDYEVISLLNIRPELRLMDNARTSSPLMHATVKPRYIHRIYV